MKFVWDRDVGLGDCGTESPGQTARRDVWHYHIIEGYNQKKFEGILHLNSDIGDETNLPNPEYDKKDNPTVPKKLFYFPVRGARGDGSIAPTIYLIPSEQIDLLPLKVLETTKVCKGDKVFERVDRLASVKLTKSKEMSYREYILKMLPYTHMVPKEWIVWKIISEVAIRDKVFLRAISYPAWGKTSTFYVLNQLRNDIEILDGGTFAKIKYSLAVHPSVLVFDEVDDLAGDDRRFLSKVIRSCGDGRGKVNNDSRAVSGTSETFDLTGTSLIALYNFPNKERPTFFETNFHPKILDRMFPVLLDGGSDNATPMLQKHEKMVGEITDEEKAELDRFLRTSLYYQEHFLDEIGDKLKWEQQHDVGRKRWNMVYTTICNGLKMFAETEEEFREYEDVLFQMHDNYLTYRNLYDKQIYDWSEHSKANRSKPSLEQTELDIL